mgnify:CR=1 FL=1
MVHFSQLAEYKQGIFGFRMTANKFSTFAILFIETPMQDSAAEGIHAPFVIGYEDGTFRPDAPRAEMAAILAKNIGVKASNAATPSFFCLYPTCFPA